MFLFFQKPRGGSGSTFLQPNVSVIVIASPLPKARAVLRHEFQPAQPLGSFPEVDILEIIAPGDGADQSAQRRTMLSGNRLAVVMGRKQKIIRKNDFNRQVGSKAVFRMLNDIVCIRCWDDKTQLP